ncbi:hypothetical protein ARMSODRAFT_505437 [Armillaria solidipes]|uniref:Uncharacterized protein n=1 Tax=Armillaria solidipes TaxID=1076256 RepID=A0A2H3CE93_9AGAR|nr:hypothetical protein ARMSODRAFT_505437 [Armillaria solidipes]
MLNFRCGWVGDCRQIYPRQFSRIFEQPNHIQSFFNAVILNIQSQVFRFQIISKSWFGSVCCPCTSFSASAFSHKVCCSEAGYSANSGIMTTSRRIASANALCKTYSHPIQATHNVSHLPRLLALQVLHNRNGSECQKVNWRFLNLADFLAAVPSRLAVY